MWLDSNIRAALVNATKEVAADGGKNQRDSGRREHILLHRAQSFIHYCEVRTLRPVYADFKLCFVNVCRNELLFHCSIKRDAAGNNCNGENRNSDSMPQGECQQPRITAIYPPVESAS